MVPATFINDLLVLASKHSGIIELVSTLVKLAIKAATPADAKRAMFRRLAVEVAKLEAKTAADKVLRAKARKK